MKRIILLLTMIVLWAAAANAQHLYVTGDAEDEFELWVSIDKKVKLDKGGAYFIQKDDHVTPERREPVTNYERRKGIFRLSDTPADLMREIEDKGYWHYNIKVNGVLYRFEVRDVDFSLDLQTAYLNNEPFPFFM